MLFDLFLIAIIIATSHSKPLSLPANISPFTFRPEAFSSSKVTIGTSGLLVTRLFGRFQQSM